MHELMNTTKGSFSEESKRMENSQTRNKVGARELFEI